MTNTSYINIKEALLFAADKLKANKIALPHLEARILLCHAIGREQEYLLTNGYGELTPDNHKIFAELLHRRLNLEPIAYILGVKEFYGRDFKVNNKVLIPRSDTEILVDAALCQTDKKPLNVLELGLGTGCIIITLLLERSEFRGTAVDISSDALLIAAKNASTHHIQDRLKLIQSDWFKAIEPQKFDIIISNPPYIPVEDKSLMAVETIKFEPELALFSSSEDGLSSYSAIASGAKDFLNTNGKLFLEVGFNQSQRVIELFTSHGYSFEEGYHDLSGHLRVVQFTLPSNLFPL